MVDDDIISFIMVDKTLLKIIFFNNSEVFYV